MDVDALGATQDGYGRRLTSLLPLRIRRRELLILNVFCRPRRQRDVRWHMQAELLKPHFAAYVLSTDAAFDLAASSQDSEDVGQRK